MRRQIDCFKQSSAQPADKFLVDLDFDEGEVWSSVSDSHSAPRSSIEMAILCKRSRLDTRRNQVADDLGTVDLDNEAFECGVIWEAAGTAGLPSSALLKERDPQA